VAIGGVFGHDHAAAAATSRGAMTTFIAVLFALTYVGMALGRVPGLRIDRSGIALIIAVVLVASGTIPRDEIAGAIHFPTLLLLGGLMILSARVGAAGFYAFAAAWIAHQAGRPLRLLALTIAVGGTFSAFLVNDVVVFAMTPLLCTGLAARGLDPRPFLFGLAAASNAGSAATLIGNPQNILIGQVGGLDFWWYLAAAAVPAVAALAITFGCIAVVWRSSLAVKAADATIAVPAFDRGQATLCAFALIGLLVLFATPLPREISALLVAACVIVSRSLPSRQLLDEIDLPLLILFACLFVVNEAFARTGLPEEAVHWLAMHGLLPERVSLLAPATLFLSNTIGNVPAVVMILEIWHDIPQGTLVGLAILSTLAGNLLLVGSLANLIVAERAAVNGVQLTLRDHARAGVPITLLSMLLGGLWLWLGGFMQP
jgi:Na+/H+ antiporter NhaD/arsenite permease-like protein